MAFLLETLCMHYLIESTQQSSELGAILSSFYGRKAL